MTMSVLGRNALQLRIALMRLGWMPCLIAVMFLLGAGAWIWLVVCAQSQTQQQTLALTQARQALRATPAVDPAEQGAASSAERNLEDFYAALGDPADAEQHLKTLFAIAAELDLHLEQGEYKWSVDRNGSLYRHQILLPVKGSYGLIRQFCERVLQAFPFASLDELSFKRESVGEDTADGNLHFTLYLKYTPQAPRAAGASES